MEVSEIRALERCMAQLTQVLEIDDVMTRLMEDDVMHGRDLERLETKRDRNERVQAFIFMLQTKGKNAFQSFINALGEHAHYQMLIKNLKEQVENAANNVQVPVAPDRSSLVNIAKKKGKPPPVPARSKPTAPNSSPLKSPVERPPSFPPRLKPKPVSKSTESDQLSIPTYSAPSRAPSDPGDKTETKTCKEIARELKQRYLHPVTEEIANCKFSELEAAKENILNGFDQEAHGSDKSAVSEALRADLNSRLRLSEIPIADFAYTDATDKHREKLHNVVVEDQYDSADLQRKFQEVDEEVLDEYQNRCRGINPEKVQQNEALLKAKMADKKQHFLCVNSTLSHALCEKLRTNATAATHNECGKVMQDDSEKSLHERVDIVPKWNEIKTKYLSEYDAKAKGPTKVEVRGNCLLEMDHDILRMELAMSDNTLTMAMNVYREKMKDMLDQLPMEEDELTRNHDQIADHVRELFCQRVRGFDERALSGPKQVLEALTDRPEAGITNANYQLSLNQCQDIANQMLQETRESSDDLLPVLNIERDGQLEKLEKLKEDALRKYDIQARGPGRDAFRMICEESIDGALRPRKKYLLLSTLQLMN